MHPIRLKWRFIEILILLAIVSLGALFVHVIGVRLDRGMQRLKTEAIALLEAKIGRRISYQSISPSVFGFLGIRDLIVYSQEDPRDILLRINRVTVYYDLIRFLTTRSVALSLSEIRIANSYFDIDYEEDRELI